MRVRSLILFDLENIVIHSNKKVLEFITLYNITNKTDINNLFIFYALLEILEIYKNNKNGLIVFYLSQNNFNILQEKGSDISYSKFIKIITKKIKFPIIISNLSFSYFCSMLASDCPEYDEIIENYIFLSSIFDDLVKIIKKLKFYKIENTFIKDLKNRLKLISTFSK
jgi:hypothetical protein